MKYFLDTEFLEGQQTKRFMGLPITKTKPTIDLISIGIVGEDNREYYAISKDFNLKEAWNRYDLDCGHGDQRNVSPKKIFWIRENVLKSIYNELASFHINYANHGEHPHFDHVCVDTRYLTFTYKNLKYLINKYGKSNTQITKDIYNFTGQFQDTGGLTDLKPEFYAYFADYDWVAFCWLFGNMMDLPENFPKYCKDLKQLLDDKLNEINGIYSPLDRDATFNEKLKWLKSQPNYPTQKIEHNALMDAKWNKELWYFLDKLNESIGSCRNCYFDEFSFCSQPDCYNGDKYKLKIIRKCQ